MKFIIAFVIIVVLLCILDLANIVSPKGTAHGLGPTIEQDFWQTIQHFVGFALWIVGIAYISTLEPLDGKDSSD